MMNREHPGLNVDFSQTTEECCESCGNINSAFQPKEENA